MTVTSVATTRGPVRPRTWVLGLAPWLSYADRFGYLPVATALGDVAAGAASVTAYLVAYGLSQPVWGLASDRWGRVRILRLGLVMLTLAGALSTIAPGPGWLIVLRGVAGAASGALLPTTLATIGDLWPPEERHPIVSRLTATASLVAGAATLIEGVVADRFGWRAALGVLVVAGVGVTAAAFRLPATRGAGTSAAAGWSAIRRGGRAAAGFYAFTFVEGAVMLGTFPLVAPLVRAAGGSVLAAGATTASYGVAAVVGALAVRRLDARHPRVVVAAGGLLLVLGTGLVGLVPFHPMVAATGAATTLGAAFSLFHGRFQALATQIVPEARGLGTGVFVGMVFTGAALGTWAGTSLAGGFGTAFSAIAVAVAAAVAWVGHRLAFGGYAVPK